jgi:hypothetical protein
MLGRAIHLGPRNNITTMPPVRESIISREKHPKQWKVHAEQGEDGFSLASLVYWVLIV